jgi:hypothetical protein
MKSGVPPTLRNARTGEFTPPGMDFRALANRLSDFAYFIEIGSKPGTVHSIPNSKQDAYGV